MKRDSPPGNRSPGIRLTGENNDSCFGLRFLLPRCHLIEVFPRREKKEPSAPGSPANRKGRFAVTLDSLVILFKKLHRSNKANSNKREFRRSRVPLLYTFKV